MRKSLLAIFSLAALGASASALAQATKYPTKPIRIIVPYAPGGGADIVARIIAQKMSETFHQSVVIDNRAGAGGRTRAVNRGPACGM